MAVTGVLILAGFVPDDAKIPLAIIFSTGSGILPAAAYAGAAVHAPKPGLVAMANGFMAQGAAIGMLVGPPLMAVVVGGFGSLGGRLVVHADLPRRRPRHLGPPLRHRAPLGARAVRRAAREDFAALNHQARSQHNQDAGDGERGRQAFSEGPVDREHEGRQKVAVGLDAGGGRV